MRLNRIRPESCRIIKTFTAELIASTWGDHKFSEPLPEPPLNAEKVWVPVEPEDDTEWLLADSKLQLDLSTSPDLMWQLTSHHKFISLPAGSINKRCWDKTITFKLGDARLPEWAYPPAQEGSFFMGSTATYCFADWRRQGYQIALYTFRVEKLDLTYMVAISVYCAKTKRKADLSVKRSNKRTAELDLTPGRYSIERLADLLFQCPFDLEKHNLLLAQQADMQVDLHPTFSWRHTKINSLRKAWAAVDLGISLYDRWPKDKRDDEPLLTLLDSLLTKYKVWFSRKNNAYHFKILKDFYDKLKAANPPKEGENADQSDQPVLDGVPPLHGGQPSGDGAAHDPGDAPVDAGPV